jgi:histidinol-phosphate aminotransferase
MSFDFQHLFRKSILELKPYSSARDEFKGSAEVFLDANENPYPHLQGFNRYPDPLQNQLKSIVSKLKGVPSEQIFLGNGSDEAIDLLFRATCTPEQDEVIYCPPTYGMYTVSASINQVKCKEIPLDSDFQPDVEAILQAGKDSKILFICSPNNPTGNLVRQDILKALLDGFGGFVVLDEAYIDFAPDSTSLKLLEEYPRLVVLQTLSKAWGLAGVRVGMAFAHPFVIGVLNKIKPPYNISLPAQQVAEQSLLKVDEMRKQVLEILNERERLVSGLGQMEPVIQIFQSDSNFVLVRFKRSQELFENLRSNGIILRDRSKQVPDALRITVGTPAENNLLMQHIVEFYRTQPC